MSHAGRLWGRLVLFGLATMFVPCSTSRAADAAKPNILLIYSDDHGWADLGAQGVDQEIRTPQLDRLASDGVRFTRGYVSAPQCVPSRAGVLTGRYQQRFGVEDNTKGPLPLGQKTIAQRLKPAGYLTGQIGKWHLGGEGTDSGPEPRPSHMPANFGFDEYFCGTSGNYVASHDLKGKPLAKSARSLRDPRFRITVQTNAALSFLDRRAARPDQPWFLYLAWYAPHVPLASPEPWFSATPANLPLERRQALAMIAAMDEGLGKIREKLKRMGEESNTLIIFIGDNGAPLKQGAWNGSRNAPLVGEKGMLTDGGVRVPFVAAWPGKLPAGLVYDKPVINLDVAATAVSVAGLPRDPMLDGVDLMPFLAGASKGSPHDVLYWRWRSQAAVLEYPWKLVKLGDKRGYLFDVTKPEGELKNVASIHPEIVDRLEGRFKTWSRELLPPGPAVADNPQDNIFFADHVDKSIPVPARRRGEEASGSVQGWICRGGTLATTPAGLLVKAAGTPAPFITHAGLNIPGPVDVVLHVASSKGGRGTITWRSRGMTDFDPGNVVAFDWPEKEGEVKLRLPISDALIHVRINPGNEVSDAMVKSIELKGKNQQARVWRFEARAR